MANVSDIPRKPESSVFLHSRQLEFEAMLSHINAAGYKVCIRSLASLVK